MHVLYEDDGAFKVATILSESDSSLQIEAPSGKRSKIKRAHVLIRFEQPGPEALLNAAHEAATELDVEFLWECAPQEEIELLGFAQEYYGHPPSAVEQAALLFCLHGAPVYFHRKGKGKYRPAPPEILQAALAALEKKKRQAEQQQAWIDDIKAGRLPEALLVQGQNLLFRPDKNSLEWKAFDQACQQLQRPPERVLMDLGLFPSALSIHKRRFLTEHFPKGTGFPALDVDLTAYHDLPTATVEAYSIDDISTTEIDDALSVCELEPGVVQIGVHIAVPALAVRRGTALDDLARDRMSTVYTPGEKIPMQPDTVIEAFSLDAGQTRPVLSLYVTARLDTGEILGQQTRVERLSVKENLRHNQLDAVISEDKLDDPDADFPYHQVFRPLWQFCKKLIEQREQVRGKPEQNNRVDFSFYIDGNPDDPEQAHVRIEQRMRNAPLDKMVAEYMILANNLWGGMLAEAGVPGVYRSQSALGRVRMSTVPAPHETMGVPQYAWFTSPLRRYIDLLNQSQLLAVVEHGISARLVAPYKPKEADLFATISAFDAKYTAYGDYQRKLENFWCLRWLKQHAVSRCEAVVLREDLVRLSDLPFVIRLGTLPSGLERGQRVLLEILGSDELDLTLECRFIDTIEAPPSELPPEADAVDESVTEAPLQADEASAIEPTAPLASSDERPSLNE